MTSSAESGNDETVVKSPPWLIGIFWLGFPLAGAVVGWLLKISAGWIASVPFAPLQGPLGLLDELVKYAGEPWATIGALIVGGVAGLIIGAIAAEEDLTVKVSDDQVTLLRGETAQVIEHASVSAVFLDGNRLVMLGPATEELSREAHDLDSDQLRDAFVNHGYPWHPDGDPYKDEFQRWVEGTPDLPANANLLLSARARALAEGDDTDLADFRKELTKLGIVVRDEKKRQYWRPTRQHVEVPSDTNTV